MEPSLITNGLPPNEGGFKVIGDIVGRRPTRTGGPRVEVEKLDRGRIVVHAYGLGGSSEGGLKACRGACKLVR